MKDYSLNEEERKNFILNYTKEEETITVNFADGSNYTIPNTESNENKLEGKMIEQVANSKERKHKAISSTGIAIVIIFLFTAASLNGAYWLGNMPQINEIALGLGIAEKNKFFVKNQEVINRGLNNTNVLVNSNVPEKEIITINDMDYSYKYNELKQIVANTERQETFSFDTFPENDVEQEKPKVRSRRR